MRLTAETYRAIDDFRYSRFVSRGVELLNTNYGKIIQSRKLPSEVLENAIKQSFGWVEEQGFPSPLLAMRMSCAKLCFGSFFMEDIRYAELSNIINDCISNYKINDDDSIHEYIVTHKDSWQSDCFAENRVLIERICNEQLFNSSNIPYWSVAEYIFCQLFGSEAKPLFILPENNEQDILKQLLSSVTAVLPSESYGSAKILLAIAQYYDGFRCFDDPLRPRWCGILAPEHRSHLYWRLQEIFSLDKTKDTNYGESRST
ncbi:hypothetical protein DPB93_25305 [Salmonella enterica subsp. salamae]|nr:hypothetical protein [Salmonella enterica subsp. salamae]ECI4078848.1 hypothetical protein [Salmonella enterica subsp. salamae]EEO2384115.1 hypothetical protein [Salmonella enterica]